MNIRDNHNFLVYLLNKKKREKSRIEKELKKLNLYKTEKITGVKNESIRTN